jgi:hypothetical protein
MMSKTIQQALNSDADLIADVVMPGGRIGKRLRSRLCPDCSFEDAEEKVLNALAKGRLRALGRRNGEGDREQIARDQWTDLQFYWAKPLGGPSPHLPHFVNNCGRYAGPRDELRHNVTYWTDVLLERKEVLAHWPNRVLESLTKNERLTLAEAVALLVRGRPASKYAWRRLRLRQGGWFPTATQQEIQAAGQEIVEMLRRRKITASGRPCVRDGGIRPTGGMKCVDKDFLDEPVSVDPCFDEIWTEFGLDDGRFSPVDRGYRYVVLKREQSLEVIRAIDAVINRSVDYEERAAHLGSPPAPASIRTVNSSPRRAIKRKGGRHARWVKHLEKHLRFRLGRRENIHSMTLTELRTDFLRYAMHHQICGVPKARSSLDEQIKRVRQQLVAEYRGAKQDDRDADPPLSEITSAPEIRRK